MNMVLLLSVSTRLVTIKYTQSSILAFCDCLLQNIRWDSFRVGFDCMQNYTCILISFLSVSMSGKHLWRNRLARSAVNRKVAGSSPARCDLLPSFCSFFLSIALNFTITGDCSCGLWGWHKRGKAIFRPGLGRHGHNETTAHKRGGRRELWRLYSESKQSDT